MGISNRAVISISEAAFYLEQAGEYIFLPSIKHEDCEQYYQAANEWIEDISLNIISNSIKTIDHKKIYELSEVNPEDVYISKMELRSWCASQLGWVPPFLWIESDEIVSESVRNEQLEDTPNMPEDKILKEACYEIASGIIETISSSQDCDTPSDNLVHENSSQLLKILLLANDRFWKDINPNNPSSFPRKEDVQDWLIKNGFSSGSLADNAAKILSEGRHHSPGRPKKEK
ncbi:hypothetical protein Q4490_09770 [Neptunomonas phycophila]|uniref:Uncharacterized protein n=1 Tax=Neptunomonas phycophila TaxID=1572645 RepID=A0AAW7XHS0_9GAMM|nr:hypothetical protein [Neptunomonas phycophila]MDO6453853.1 hypothetical protein [Neptunomonas phycophila]